MHYDVQFIEYIMAIFANVVNNLELYVCAWQYSFHNMAVLKFLNSIQVEELLTHANTN